MKFTCEKYLLSEAANLAARAAALKSPVPALDGLLIRAEGSSVRITGYDLKKGIYTSFDADVEKTGQAVITARLFCDIIRNMPDGMVTVTVSDNNMCSIVCGSSEFNIMGADPEDYPELPIIDMVDCLTIPQNTIRKMINETLFAVSDNESRPVYTGSLFEIKNGALTIVSIDGFRLALRRENIDGGKDSLFIVPGTALSELEKICSDSDEEVRITLGTKHISFAVGATVLLSRRLDGEFMDYAASVPTDHIYEITVDRGDLMRMVDRVSLVIDDKNKNPLRFKFTENEISCDCVTVLGKAEDNCASEGDGEGLEIGFNNRYLKDALKSAPAERVKLCLKSGTSPIVIRPLEGDSFVYMILPVRLKAE